MIIQIFSAYANIVFDACKLTGGNFRKYEKIAAALEISVACYSYEIRDTDLKLRTIKNNA